MIFESKSASYVTYDERTYETNPALRSYLENGSLDRLIESVSESVIVVLGGDGTMLRAIRQNYAKGLPFIGLNFGHKGFLLNESEYVRDGSNFTSVEYPLLSVRLEQSDRVSEDVAFNEICFKSIDGALLATELTIGDSVEVRTKSDGWIVSTPAGSTGYNRSASGPVIPHSAKLSIATPLVPFDPRDLPSIPYEQDSRLEIRTVGDRPNQWGVFVDGGTLVTGASGEARLVVSKAHESVRLLIESEYYPLWSVKGLVEQ